MQPDAVRIEQQGAVTVVTLDRADVRNAVDSDTARRLHEAFIAFDEDPEARVAVFHGANGRSDSDLRGSGTTRSRSMPITRPNPWHSGQAPSGELKEKSAGVGRRTTVPHTGQESSRE